MCFNTFLSPAALHRVGASSKHSSSSTASSSGRRLTVQVAAAQQEPNVRHGSVVAKPEQRYGVVVGRFNDLVTKLLLEGAKGAFAAHGVSMSNVEVSLC
jgi:hypothetical protein